MIDAAEVSNDHDDLTRLRHSLAGYLRLLQISPNVALVVLVEGPPDIYFWSRIVDAAGLRGGFAIRSARDLPGSTGGKKRLLAFYDYLRQSGSLCSTLEGKKTAVLFFLDKDVDDVLRSKRRSRHVIYSIGYERENYLYEHGDVNGAVAAIGHVSPNAVADVIPSKWTVVAAETWRHWLIICLLSRVINVNVAANYGMPSQLNGPCDAPTNLAEYVKMRDNIRTASGLDLTTFDRLALRVDRLVTARFKAGSHSTLFRGKWYAIFLRAWTGAVIRGTLSEEQLSTVLAVSLPYEAAWSAHLRESVRQVAIKCGLVTVA